MPDIASVLERAAATPTRGPDIARPLRRQRRRRIAAAISVASAVVVGVVVLTAVLRPQHGNGRVEVQPPAPVTRVTSHGASIEVPGGWYATTKPLAPWLYSPFEVFSIATTTLEPSPLPGNQAACPSEIPRAAVDGIASDGAYLWIGEWRGGIYEPAPRPSTFDGVTLPGLCKLPRGLAAYGGVDRDGTTDFQVTMVFGPDATPERRAEIDRMLDSLRF